MEMENVPIAITGATTISYHCTKNLRYSFSNRDISKGYSLVAYSFI
jgi:hypothetical protein